MPYEFVCPYCHAKTWVANEYRGRSGPCAECGRVITIPPLPSSLMDAEPRPLEDASSSPSGSSASQSLGGNSKRPKRTLLVRTSVQLVVLVVVVALAASFYSTVIPRVRQGLENRTRQVAMNRIKQVAEALNGYRQIYGSYPPPVVRSSDGTPLYSWRVLILPMLGYNSLYNEFQLDQAWDTPANMSVSRRMPNVFSALGEAGESRSSFTHFFLIVGDQTLFPESGMPVDPMLMTDSEMDTLLVVEGNGYFTEWTEPGDVVYSGNLSFGNGKDQLGGQFSGGAIAATVANEAIFVLESIPPSTLQAMVTPNGGEVVDLSRHVRN